MTDRNNTVRILYLSEWPSVHGRMRIIGGIKTRNLISIYFLNIIRSGIVYTKKGNCSTYNTFCYGVEFEIFSCVSRIY